MAARYCRKCREELSEDGSCRWCRFYDNQTPTPPKRDKRKGA